MICGIFNAAAGNPKRSCKGGGTGKWTKHCTPLPFPRDTIAAGAKTRGEMSPGAAERGRDGGTHVPPRAPPGVTRRHSQVGRVPRAEGKGRGEVGEGSGLRNRSFYKHFNRHGYIAVFAAPSGTTGLVLRGAFQPRTTPTRCHFEKVSATSVFCPTSGGI